MLLELFISELVLLSAYAMPAPSIPIAQIAHIEAHSEVDFTGQGRCRVENTSMEKGWVYFGTTQKGYHFSVEEDIGEVKDPYLACFRKELYSDGVR